MTEVDRKLRFVMLAAGCCLLAAAQGCDDDSSSGGPLQGNAAVGDQRGQFFQTFAANLNNLEDFPPEQMLPLLRDHLNHWQREHKPEISWQQDAVVDSLPKPLRDLPQVKRIGALDYDLADMQFLMQCVWLRDIAKTARGEGVDEVAIASRLFDWTIRNLQIAPDTAENGLAGNHSLAETLLLGKATALERASVFIQLCRQLGLEAVMLAIPEGDDKSKLRPWLPAVRVKDELYLFDPRLGLPIPGPDGKSVATLSQVAADDGLLRALDLDAEHPYPVKASDVQSVVALVEASPEYLSRGMKLVESNLAGEERVILTAAPSKSIEGLKKLKHVGDASLWLRPYEVLQARNDFTKQPLQNLAREMVVYYGPAQVLNVSGGRLPPREMSLFQGAAQLYGARIRQLKGDLEGDQGAKHRYLLTRPPQSEIDASAIPDEQKKVLSEVKQDATFWLGLIAHDEKHYPGAIDWLRERVLIASPEGPWTAGARYNLGRTYEAMGDMEKAASHYLLDKSPQSVGNKLRARRLLSKP